jgi:hypothetical protein
MQRLVGIEHLLFHDHVSLHDPFWPLPGEAGKYGAILQQKAPTGLRGAGRSVQFHYSQAKLEVKQQSSCNLTELQSAL